MAAAVFFLVFFVFVFIFVIFGVVGGRTLAASARGTSRNKPFEKFADGWTSWTSFVSIRVFASASTARSRATLRALFAVPLRRTIRQARFVLNVRRVAAPNCRRCFGMLASEHVFERTSTAIIERVPGWHASSSGDVSSIHFLLSQFPDALVQSVLDAASIFNRTEFWPRFAFA